MAAPVLFTLILAAGAAVGTLSAWRRGARILPTMLTGLSRAPALALGTLSLSLFFGSFLVGRAPTVLTLLLVFGALAALFLAFGFRSTREGNLALAPERWGGRTIVIAVLLAVAVVGIAVTFVMRSGLQPHGKWDAMAVWNMLARTLARADSEIGSILGAMTQGAPGYPHNLPGSIASLFRLHGSETAFFEQAVAASWLCGLALTLFLSLRRRGSRVLACAGTLLLLTTPGFVDVAAGQYADVALACLLLCAVASLATLFEQGNGIRTPPLLAGFYVGLLPWTKNEGQIMAAILMLLLVLACLRKRIPRRVLGAVVLGMVPGLLAFILFKIYWAPTDYLLLEQAPSVIDRLLDPERWQRVLQAFASELSSGGSLPWDLSTGASNPYRWRWGALWPALGLILLTTTSPRRLLRDPALRFMAAVVTLQFLAIFASMLLLPTLQEMVLSQSLGRILLQATPALILVIVASTAPAKLELEPHSGALKNH